MFYVYDGSFEGFLSAITVVMRSHSSVLDKKRPFYGIISENAPRPLLDYKIAPIIPSIIFDFGNYIQQNFGETMTKTIYHAFLSEAEGIEDAITEYIFLARKQHRDPIDQLYQDCVKKVAGAAKTVTRESHHYLGLLRFRKVVSPDNCNEFPTNDSLQSGTKQSTNSIDHQKSLHSHDPSVFDTSLLSIEDTMSSLITDGSVYEKSDKPLEIFVADCEPVTCALPLIAEHFVERFPNQIFIIFDRRRSICVIHFKSDQWIIKPYDPKLDISIHFDSSFELIWQKYFKTLAIPERINPKLQMGNMPKRYWKYLIEKPGKQK